MDLKKVEFQINKNAYPKKTMPDIAIIGEIWTDERINDTLTRWVKVWEEALKDFEKRYKP